MPIVELVAVCCMIVQAATAQPAVTEIEFCQLSLPSYVKDGSFSFYVLYSLVLDDAGAPISITPLKADYVDEQEVRACISAWRLPNLAGGAKVVVSFRWTHGIGWTELGIGSGAGFSQRIRLSGVRAPYPPPCETPVPTPTPAIQATAPAG